MDAARLILAPETAARARGVPLPPSMPAEAEADVNVVKDPVRYKTVMCQNWVTRGSCPYGLKCQFAHGDDEMRSKPSKHRGRARGEGKARRGAAGAKAGAAGGLAAVGASIRTTAAVARHPGRRPEPPPSPQLRPSSSGDRTPSPFFLPRPLLSRSWDGLAKPAPPARRIEQLSQPAAQNAPCPPCASEMLELSKAALEQSILLSHRMASFVLPTSYVPVMPQMLRPMPQPLPHPACRAPRAPLPPASLATLMGQERMQNRMTATCISPRDLTGLGRSSGEWSAASTALGSLDSAYGDDHSAAAAAALSSLGGNGLDELHLDMCFDGHFDDDLDALDMPPHAYDLRGPPLNFPPRPLPPPASFSSAGRPTVGLAPDSQSIANSLSFLWGDERTDVAPDLRCRPSPLAVKLPPAPGPAPPIMAPVDLAAETLRSSYASALQEIDFSKGAAHVACQLDRLLSTGAHAPAAVTPAV